MIELDEPAATSVSWTGRVAGVGATDGAALAAALASGDAAALASADASADAAALALGSTLGGGAATISAQEPATISVGIGSANPIATTPSVTADDPSPRSVMIPPPKILLAFASWNVRSVWVIAAEGEASTDGATLAP